jgi:hypothetical protein
MLELTQEQRQKLTGPEPLRVLDPATQQRYVLVREEVYERMRSLLDEGALTTREVGALIEQTMREYDADDPLLDSYQQYRP